jgi:hypothetical protein
MVFPDSPQSHRFERDTILVGTSIFDHAHKNAQAHQRLINEHLLSGIVVGENTDDLGKNNNITTLSFNVLGKNKSRTFKDIRDDDEGCVNNPPGEPHVNIVRSCSISVSVLGSYPFADCVQFFDVFRFFCVKIATL